MLRDSIQHYVQDAVKKTGYVKTIGGVMWEKVTLVHPHTQFGDFASNVAFIIAEKQDNQPATIAERVADELKSANHKEIQSISVASSGFINIYLTDEVLTKEAKKIVKKGKGVVNNILNGTRVSVEYTDANPFKSLHLGHLMTNAIGESFAHLVEAVGGTVVRVCYQGDVGLHVAKCIWALAQDNLENITPTMLSEAYVRGDSAYERGGKEREEIQTYNTHIYERTEQLTNALYDEGKRISLDYFETIYKRIGTKFDEYIFESETAPVGLQEVERGLESGVFVRDNDAIIFKGEKDNLHTRVFVTSQGLPTYEAKEIGLALIKEERLSNSKKHFVVTANEITLYMKVVVAALKKLHPTIAEKIEHIPHGVLSLTTGKMSSRSGKAITAETLLNQSMASVIEQAKKNETKLNDKTANTIAVAAIKYAILRQANGKNVVFDMQQATSFEGDSGAYLLYALVRSKALLKRGGMPNSETEVYGHLPLLRLLYQFEEKVVQAYKARESHHIVQYLTKLTSVYSQWYASEKILEQEDSEERLQLVLVFTKVLQRGLTILGIQSVDKM